MGRLSDYIQTTSLWGARNNVSNALEYHTSDMSQGGLTPTQAHYGLLNAVAGACIEEMQAQLPISVYPSLGESACLGAFYRLSYEIDGSTSWYYRLVDVMASYVPAVAGGVVERMAGPEIGNVVQQAMGDLTPQNSLADKANAVQQQFQCAAWWTRYELLRCR